MITSLIKVGLLSFISAISPLKAVSSYNESTADNEISVKANIKKAVGTVDYTPLVLNKYDKTYQEYFPTGISSRNFTLYGDFKLDDTANLGDSGYKEYKQINFTLNVQPRLLISFTDSANNTVMFYDSNSIMVYDTLYTCFIKGGITGYSASYGLTVNDCMRIFNNMFSSSYVNFKFDNQINYNALFELGLNVSYFETPSGVSHANISQVLFYSNGRFFDTVNTSYDFADGKTFLVDGKDSSYNYVYYTVPSTPPTAYSYVNQITYDYAYIDYTDNTIHGRALAVNQRNNNFYYDSDSGTSTNFIDNSSSWVISDYQDIRIYIADELAFNKFKSFNNADFVINYDYISSYNIPYINGTDMVSPNQTTGFWLKDAFNLINMGVTGIIGFLNIKVFPDLTIGAFILVPFAVSLLIIVLKLFKR